MRRHAQQREVLARRDAGDLRRLPVDRHLRAEVDDVRGRHDEPVADDPARAAAAARAAARRVDAQRRRAPRPGRSPRRARPRCRRVTSTTASAATRRRGDRDGRVGEPPPAARAVLDEPSDHRPRRAPVGLRLRAHRLGDRRARHGGLAREHRDRDVADRDPLAVAQRRRPRRARRRRACRSRSRGRAARSSRRPRSAPRACATRGRRGRPGRRPGRARRRRPAPREPRRRGRRPRR